MRCEYLIHIHFANNHGYPSYIMKYTRNSEIHGLLVIKKKFKQDINLHIREDLHQMLLLILCTDLFLYMACILIK